MDIMRRIALVIRSYLRSTGERIDKIGEQEELREARARSEALEEMKSGDGAPSLGRSAEFSAASRVSARLAEDYRLLGLQLGAEIEAVEAAWRRLAERADPKRFPEGSEEEKKAAAILKSINESYARIREALNPTEGRFGRLEI